VLEFNITVKHPEGLHARPAAQLVKTAQQFKSEITVVKGRWKADAKSILEILTLGVNQGSEVCILADGEDAEQAVKALCELIETNFGDVLSKTNETGE